MTKPNDELTRQIRVRHASLHNRTILPRLRAIAVWPNSFRLGFLRTEPIRLDHSSGPANDTCMKTQMSKRVKQRKNTANCCGDVAELMQPAFFKAPSDPNRIAILARLAECCRACTVSEIAECCPVNVSVVSRHLAMLRDAGILEARKVGKEVHYSVRYSALADSLRQIADAIDACCPATTSNVKTKTKSDKQVR